MTKNLTKALLKATFFVTVPLISSFSFQSKTFKPPTATRTGTALFSEPPKNELSIILDPALTEERTKSLFAWISCAFRGYEEYNNLMLGIAGVFGTNLPSDSLPSQLIAKANKLLPADAEQTIGEPIRRFEREQNSLGAMGAGQWLGQFKTRPHALLKLDNITDVDEWKKTLPRGCKRTLKKANQQNFTVTTKPIKGGEPAPHSSLSHFNCVLEHEVRLITGGEEGDVEGFFDALQEAIGRYMGTTRMTGEIQEYRNEEGKIIAFAHEVRKGRTVRGQWFYCTNEGAKNYVWFHSVQELVKRAIEADGVDTVDLGPSGNDAFSELKARYGFESVDDWPAVADYTGPFFYEGEEFDEEDDDERQRLMKLLRMLGQ